MPTVTSRVLVVLVFLLLVPAATALAWDEPAGSPPAWQSRWVQTVQPSAMFISAEGDLSFGQIASNRYLRVDAPPQAGRLWVYDPLTRGWAWLPGASARRTPEPTLADVEASAPPPDPRQYLYDRAPDLAPRLDCIIEGESGWDPTQQNPRSRAAGLAQFLPSTWAATPQGQLGLSPFDPLASVDGAIWLARARGLTQWQVYTQGACHTP